MRKSVWLFSALTFLGCHRSPIVPVESNQLLVGLADDWDSTTVELRAFARAGSAAPWRLVSTKTANIGRKGLAPGLGLMPLAAAGVAPKVEGDGKAPAGIFRLSAPYGYGDGLQRHPGRLIEITPTWMCIEDSDSARYNSTLDVTGVTSDWKSTETMLRPDGLYSRLMIVGHNGGLGGPVVKRGGSCIFFHLQRGPGRPTAGCTSLAAEDLDEILDWIQPSSHPVYVLMTRNWYRQVAAQPNSGLPQL